MFDEFSCILDHTYRSRANWYSSGRRRRIWGNSLGRRAIIRLFQKFDLIYIPSGASMELIRALDTSILQFARWQQISDDPDWYIQGNKTFRSRGLLSYMINKFFTNRLPIYRRINSFEICLSRPTRLLRWYKNLSCRISVRKWHECQLLFGCRRDD